MLNALIEELQQQGATTTEINTLKEQAATQGLGSAINHAQNLIMAQKIAELSQADMTEAQKLEAYKSTPEYIARQEALAEWYAQQQKIAELSQADMTEAQKLEVYKSTPEYIAHQEALAEWYAQQQKIAELSQADMTEAQKLEVYKSTPEYIAYQESLAEWQAQQEAELASQTYHQEESWWNKTVNWIDQHQPLASVGVGVLIGLATIGITLAVATVTLPVILTAVAIATVVTAVTVATGTIALNHHFDRSPTTNIVSNILWGAGAALITTAGALAIVAGCATPIGMPVCAAVPPVLDTIEQVSLQVQFAYETATGNPNAGQTYIELQLELNDGGAPGNKIVTELGEQLGKLSNNQIPSGAFSSIPEIKLEPYTPVNAVVGQLYDYSCVSASCAAILNAPDLQEGIMELVGTNSTYRASISNAVSALSEYSNKNYTYVETIDFKTLKEALGNGPAIISINTTGVNHAIVIDSISADGYFHVRDPLPQGQGSSYKIRASDIWEYWVRDRGAIIAEP